MKAGWAPRAARALPEIALALGLGAFAALLAVAGGKMGADVIAIALPIGLALAGAALARPEVGALALIFVSYLDGLSDMVFKPSILSGFELFLMLTLTAVVMNASSHRDHLRRVFSAPVMLLGLCFIVVWMLAIVFAMDRGVAINWGKRLFFISLITPILMLSLRDARAIRLAIWCLALASLISSVVLLLDVALKTHLVSTTEAATRARTSGGFNRSSGASQANPTTAATMMLCGTVVALVHAIESPRARRFMILVAAVGTMGTVMSFSRSAFLTYMMVIFALGLRYGRHRNFGSAAALGVILLVAMLPFVPAQYFARIGTIFSSNSGDWTLGRRLTYNVIGLELLRQNPLLGIGPGNFYAEFTDPAYRYLPGRTLGGRQLHNMYLSIAVEYGLVGITVFGALIAQAFRACRQVAEAPCRPEFGPLAVSLSYGMMAYFLNCLFLPSEYIKYTWILPALAGALALVNARLRDDAAAT